MQRHAIFCSASGGAGIGKPYAPRAGGLAKPQTDKLLRICVNKTCKRQGSELLLRFVQDLGDPTLKANSCGCLGQCGSGPNMVLLPAEKLIRHVATPADMAEVLNEECGMDVSKDLLKATELRQIGNSMARSGDLKGAEEKFTEALALGVPESYYLLYSNRSGVRLSLGDKQGTLDDALLGVQHAPKGFVTAYIRLIDAHYIRKEFHKAQEALEALVERNPEYKRTNEFKLLARQLQKDVQCAM